MELIQKIEYTGSIKLTDVLVYLNSLSKGVYVIVNNAKIVEYNPSTMNLLRAKVEKLNEDLVKLNTGLVNYIMGINDYAKIKKTSPFDNVSVFLISFGERTVRVERKQFGIQETSK